MPQRVTVSPERQATKCLPESGAAEGASVPRPAWSGGWGGGGLWLTGSSTAALRPYPWPASKFPVQQQVGVGPQIGRPLFQGGTQFTTRDLQTVARAGIRRRMCSARKDRRLDPFAKRVYVEAIKLCPETVNTIGGGVGTRIKLCVRRF